MIGSDGALLEVIARVCVRWQEADTELAEAMTRLGDLESQVESLTEERDSLLEEAEKSRSEGKNLDSLLALGNSIQLVGGALLSSDGNTLSLLISKAMSCTALSFSDADRCALRQLRLFLGGELNNTEVLR